MYEQTQIDRKSIEKERKVGDLAPPAKKIAVWVCEKLRTVFGGGFTLFSLCDHAQRPKSLACHVLTARPRSPSAAQITKSVPGLRFDGEGDSYSIHIRATELRRV